MEYLAGIAVGVVIVLITQTIIERRKPSGWNLADALKHVKPIDTIDDLRIPGLTDDEADEFWHAVNDDPATTGEINITDALRDNIAKADHGDVIEWGSDKYIVIKDFGGQ